MRSDLAGQLIDIRHGMMRFVGKMAALCGGMLIAIMIARGLGSAQLMSAFARQLSADLTQQRDVWCWREICPIASSTVSVVQALSPYAGSVERRYGNVYWTSPEEPSWSADIQMITDPPVVFYIQLTPPQTTMTYTLAEAMLQFGTPINVQVERDLNEWIVFVCFRHGVCGGMLTQDLRLKPMQVMAVVNISRTGAELSGNRSRRVPGLYPWQGLERVRRR